MVGLNQKRDLPIKQILTQFSEYKDKRLRCFFIGYGFADHDLGYNNLQELM